MFHRKSIRLKDYDYRQVGGYFVTIVTHNRLPLFGEQDQEIVRLNEIGRLARGVWQSLPAHFSVTLDALEIMPDHLHGILFLNEEPCAAEEKPLHGTASGSLSAIIQNYKSVCTVKINQMRRTPGGLVWQRNFYESVIRSEKHYAYLRGYILENPARHYLKTVTDGDFRFEPPDQ